MSVEEAKLNLAILSLAEKISTLRAPDDRRFIVGGNAIGKYENGTFEVKSNHGTGAYSTVASPSKGAVQGASVLMGNPNGDGQDMVILGMSGYYYP